MRFARRGIKRRWLSLGSRAQELQANELTYAEGPRAIDRWARLSEFVRFVVISAWRHQRFDVRSRLRLRLAHDGHMQQARRWLPELLRDEQALWTPGLDGHAQ